MFTHSDQDVDEYSKYKNLLSIWNIHTGEQEASLAFFNEGKIKFPSARCKSQ